MATEIFHGSGYDDQDQGDVGRTAPWLGTETEPGAEVRRNRVVVTLTDSELAELHRWAAGLDLPVGTLAYEIVERALSRRESSRDVGGKK